MKDKLDKVIEILSNEDSLDSAMIAYCVGELEDIKAGA